MAVKQPRVFRYTTFVSQSVRDALGIQPHVRQALVFGAFPSVAAFIRALTAEGIERDNPGTYARVRPEVSEWGPHAADVAEPGVLYVTAMTGSQSNGATLRYTDVAR